MAALSIAEIRRGFADVIERVEGSKERMIITRRNKPVAALVPMDDAALLERLEDDLDLLEAIEAIKDYESAGGVSLRRLKTDLAL
jgi:prevent-host-death family protein